MCIVSVFIAAVKSVTSGSAGRVGWGGVGG